MNTQHTPGLLIVRGYYSIYAEDRTPVADTYMTASTPENDHANARRLVACWNALNGIPLSDIESASQSGSISYALHKVILQRDDLLAALKGILAVASVRIDDPRIAQWDAARAAIAKATGI
jgi:hypothetical protein